MICKNCGKEFDSRFCPDCGTGQTSAKNWMAIAAQVCGAGAIIFALILVLLLYNESVSDVTYFLLVISSLFFSIPGVVFGSIIRRKDLYLTKKSFSYVALWGSVIVLILTSIPIVATAIIVLIAELKRLH